MGINLNPSNEKFIEAVNSPIYVDKTELISYTNSVLGTSMKYICMSRPRRFGKSMAANMLTAYYSRGCDSKELFAKFKIAQNKDFETYRNQYDVIFLNMQEFLSRTDSVRAMIELLKKRLLWELFGEYPDAVVFDKTDLVGTMQDIYAYSKRPFVIIIDEWDCVLREKKAQQEEQRYYLDFLRDMLKDKENIRLVYMTGILPIKKYGTHSALNMFCEYSMVDAGQLAEYVGFTETEVKQLCREHSIDFEEIKQWYNGYQLNNAGAIYNPQSVVFSIQSEKISNYWSQTETYEALKVYIDMNFEGLKDDIIAMMDGGRVDVQVRSFSNDMTNLGSKDDVLTLLIHLGYLGYDFDNQEVFIPNVEIESEFANAVRNSDWGIVTRALELSQRTLKAIWEKDEVQVAKGIEDSHLETAHLTYNDENALSYTISLALYAARNYYTVVREFPTGKGYADMVFLPRKRHMDKPAIIVELKWNRTADGAIEQIKNKEYGKALEEYSGKLLLVGINYDKSTREHECRIEELEK